MAAEFLPNEIFIGNLDKSGKHNEDDLKAFFSQFGSIVKLEIKKDMNGVSKGFGFIGFDSEGAVTAVLNNHANNTLNGIWIDAKRADKRGPGAKFGKGGKEFGGKGKGKDSKGGKGKGGGKYGGGGKGYQQYSQPSYDPYGYAPAPAYGAPAPAYGGGHHYGAPPPASYGYAAPGYRQAPY